MLTYPKAGLATVIPDSAEEKPYNAYFTPPKNKNYPVNWLVLWQSESEIGVSLMEQAKSDAMTLIDYRVRDYLMGSIGIGNYVFVNQSEIARELRVHRISVVHSIKRLCDMKILSRGPKSGRSNTYMVNPAFCFRGGLPNGVKQRNEAIKENKANVIPFQKQGSLLEGV